MKMIVPLSIVLSLAGWVFISLTATNVLSGPFEGRTCQTDCVKTYFYTAIGLGISGLITALIAVMKDRNVLSYIALAMSMVLCGIFATLFVIGNI